MPFEDLIQKVDTIDSGKGYWFVRTDDGKYYQNFYENNFIAIGWNYITIEQLRNADPTGFDIRQKIAQHENLDIVNNAVDKGKATTIYNKLLAFKNLKRGDVIIIPSDGSKRLAFGIIADDTLYPNIDDPSCDFFKRRRVRWVTNKDIDELDNIFYQVKINRHTISSVKNFESHIDKVMKTLFIKNGASHFVLDIKTQEEINFDILLELMNNIKFLTRELNQEFNLGENLNENSIKLNLQSPGKIELKFINSKSLILLATLLGPLTVGNEIEDVNNNEVNQLEEFREVHQESIDSIETAMDELEIDQDKINSIY